MIRIHENAFEFFGGVPEEVVYDQDNLILTSENYGDLIYTQAFFGYLQKRKFRVYMCRKGDPESKGKVKNVVGYVKNNYARYRTFYNIDQWNENCLSWLHRRYQFCVPLTSLCPDFEDRALCLFSVTP